MKTFKQLMEELPKPVTPKQFDVNKSDTMFIRTPDIIKKAVLPLSPCLKTYSSGNILFLFNAITYLLVAT